MTEKAQKLRERVAKALDGLMPGEYEPFDEDEAAHVLRAVVEELDVTDENLALLDDVVGRMTRRGDYSDGVVAGAHCVLATLLEASGADR